MKKILGLDLGTNSIGWALTTHDFELKKGEINGLGSKLSCSNSCTSFYKHPRLRECLGKKMYPFKLYVTV